MKKDKVSASKDLESEEGHELRLNGSLNSSGVMSRTRPNCMAMSRPRLINKQRGIPVIEDHKAGTGYDLDESFGVDSVEGIGRKELGSLSRLCLMS